MENQVRSGKGHKVVGDEALDLNKIVQLVKDAGGSDVWVDLKATLRVLSCAGADERQVAKRIKFVQDRWRESVETLEELLRRGDDAENERCFADETFAAISTDFAECMSQALQDQDNAGLLQDWENVDQILSKGVDDFAQAVQDLVGTAGVHIWFEELEITLPEADVSGVSGPNAQTSNIATQLYDLTCGPFVNLFSILRKTCGGARSNSAVANIDDNAGKLHLLHSSSGVLESGRLTLVLGPPGCGKTTFLKAIAGEPSLAAQASSKVFFNSRSQASLGSKVAKMAAYVQQSDNHLALLTVEETIHYAWLMKRGYKLGIAGFHKWLDKSIGEEKAARVMTLERLAVELVVSVLGLDMAKRTIIGNATLRGVSGGEKRRVTLGETLAFGTDVLCCDSISDGLDSATTYEIVQYLRAVSHFLGKTVVVGLLQPPPEVVDLFDDVVVLANGRTVYQGPRELALDHFASLGFVCPPHMDMGDFLQELPGTLSSAQGRSRFWSSAALAAESPPPPQSVSALEQRWKASPVYAKYVAEKLAVLKSTTRAALAAEEEPTATEFDRRNIWREFRFCLDRCWLLTKRNPLALKARSFQNLNSAILYGSLFFQIPADQWYIKAMLFARVPAFMAAGVLGKIAPTVVERPVYYKHLDSGVYRALPLLLARFVDRIPMKLLDAMLFGNAIYWMCGLAADPGRYAMFMLLSILWAQVMDCFIDFLAFAFADSSFGLVVGIFSYMALINLSGQVATPDVIPSYLKPVFYASPLSHVYQALAINEFKASTEDYDRVPCVLKDGVNISKRCGDVYLENRQFPTDEGAITVALVVLVSYIVGFLILGALALTYCRFKPGQTYSTSTPAPSQAATAQGNNNNNNNNIDELFAGEELPANALSASLLQRQGSSMSVPPQTLTFCDLFYTVEVAKNTTVDLLKGVSGWALPGKLTALMGTSGAGKTTLLDCLCGRKTVGSLCGKVCFNNETLGAADLAQLVAYVEQFGIHEPHASVYESVLFSASMRLPRSEVHLKKEFVEEVLDMLDLQDIRDALCVNLSMEQNKRLTVAVELAANPSVLFADEPTTGLNAPAALQMVKCLKTVARSRTVVATIHQPSMAVFEMFDELIFLQRGGTVVFQGALGHHSSNLVEYFESLPGVPALPRAYNPATWMLEIVGADGAASSFDQTSVSEESASPAAGSESDGAHTSRNSESFSQLYLQSGLYRSNMRKLRGMMRRGSNRPHLDMPSPDHTSLSMPTRVRRRKQLAAFHSSVGTSPTHSAKYRSYRSDATEELGADVYTPLPRVSLWHQVWFVLKRNSVVYWRNSVLSLTRILNIMAVTLLLTVCFFQQRYYSVADVQSRVSAIGSLISFGGNYNCFNTMIPLQQRRVVFYRERASGMYSVIAPVVSDALIEIPFLLIQALIASNLFYWAVGLQDNQYDYLIFTATFFLFLIVMTYVGMLLAIAAPTPFAGIVFANTIIELLTLTAGVIVPYHSLPTFYKAFYWISPLRFSQETMVASQFHDDSTIVCQPQGRPLNASTCTVTGLPDAPISGVPVPASEYVLNDFLSGYSWDHRYLNLAMLGVTALVLRVLAGVAATCINHNKR